MLPFAFDPGALQDARAGVRHYNRKPPRRGREFQIAVKSTIGELRKYPKLGVPHIARIRKGIVPDFAATLFYIDYPDRIWIVAVSLAGRSPDYWLDRIPSG